MEHRQNRDNTFANVVCRNSDALLFEVVDVNVVANGFGDARLQAAFVCSARTRSNSVHVAANLFVGRFCPLQNAFDFGVAVVFFGGEHRFVNRFLLTLVNDLR